MPKKNNGKNNGKRGRVENLKSFKPGESGNPNGRPLGQRNYATIYKEALIKLADKRGMTPEDLENEILLVGLEKAAGGDYRFYQDLQDRLNGKPVQRNELTGADGKDLIPDANSKKKTDGALDSFLKKKK